MFGPPEPADRLWFDAAKNQWRTERTTVQMGRHVEDMGSTHNIIYFKDLTNGHRDDILVAKVRAKPDEDLGVEEERILTHVKVMSIAQWYAARYNEMIRHVPLSSPIKFLSMWAYVLVSRKSVVMVQGESFAVDYLKFTYDSIPQGLPIHVDRSEIDNSFLFALYTFEQTDGNLLICNPVRVSHVREHDSVVVWGLPKIASTDGVGCYMDEGKKFMFDYMTSHAQPAVKNSFALNMSDLDLIIPGRERFLRSLRLVLVQSTSIQQRNQILMDLMSEAIKYRSEQILLELLEKLSEQDAYDSSHPPTPHRRRFVRDLPKNTHRETGAELNPFLDNPDYNTKYGGLLYTINQDQHGRQSGPAWKAPDFTKEPPPRTPPPVQPPRPPTPEPLLPDGWIMKIDYENGRRFYLHSGTGIVKWKVPDAHDHAEAELQAKLAEMTEKEAIALGLKPYNPSLTNSHLNQLDNEPEADLAVAAELHMDSVNDVIEPLTFQVQIPEIVADPYLSANFADRCMMMRNSGTVVRRAEGGEQVIECDTHFNTYELMQQLRSAYTDMSAHPYKKTWIPIPDADDQVPVEVPSILSLNPVSNTMSVDSLLRGRMLKSQNARHLRISVMGIDNLPEIKLYSHQLPHGIPLERPEVLRLQQLSRTAPFHDVLSMFQSDRQNTPGHIYLTAECDYGQQHVRTEGRNRTEPAFATDLEIFVPRSYTDASMVVVSLTLWDEKGPDLGRDGLHHPIKIGTIMLNFAQILQILRARSTVPVDVHDEKAFVNGYIEDKETITTATWLPIQGTYKLFTRENKECRVLLMFQMKCQDVPGSGGFGVKAEGAAKDDGDSSFEEESLKPKRRAEATFGFKDINVFNVTTDGDDVLRDAKNPQISARSLFSKFNSRKK